jgi:hypothetical protein
MDQTSLIDAELKQGIANFRQHIRTYQATLKQQGTWLLLATLGCWSVSPGFFQLFAYAIVLFVFVDRISERMGDDRSFAKINEAISQRIESSELPEDTRKARMWDLKEVNESERGTKVTLRRNVLFFACWTFYGLSLLVSTPMWKAVF